MTQFYSSDFDAFSLQTQLQSFKEEFKDEAKSDIYLMKIVESFQQMKRDPGQQWKLDYYSQVAILVKLILVLPATNAISERSFSAMHQDILKNNNVTEEIEPSHDLTHSQSTY